MPSPPPPWGRESAWVAWIQAQNHHDLETRSIDEKNEATAKLRQYEVFA